MTSLIVLRRLSTTATLALALAAAPYALSVQSGLQTAAAIAKEAESGGNHHEAGDDRGGGRAAGQAGDDRGAHGNAAGADDHPGAHHQRGKHK